MENEIEYYNHIGPKTYKFWKNLDYPLKLVRIHKLLAVEMNHSHEENLFLQKRQQTTNLMNKPY